MSENILQHQIFTTADRLLMAGVKPTALVISQSLGCDEGEVEGALDAWWPLVPERITLADRSISIPDLPESLNRIFSQIWQQAVQEASSHFVAEKHQQEVGVEEVRREADESVQLTRSKLLDLEEKYRTQQTTNDEAQAIIKGLEAEVEVLKNNLAAETSLLKKEEQNRLKVEQELAHLRKSHDDTKRTFDQRIKDEQRHTLDAISKADADVRYYRGALEKLRDEVGKKESALTKNIHELQAELARKDVKSDTQKTQIKSLEEELKTLKLNSSGQNRDLSKTNNQLLVESNKNKRLEDKVKELEEEVRKARQKQVSLTNEQSRRENAIRNQLKEKEDELIKVLAKMTGMEKKMIAQDEEIRRLNSRF